MDHHLEAIGLIVAHADLDLTPLTIRWAYAKGATRAQVQDAMERGSRLGNVSAALRPLAEEPARVCAPVAGHASTA